MLPFYEFKHLVYSAILYFASSQLTAGGVYILAQLTADGSVYSLTVKYLTKASYCSFTRRSEAVFLDLVNRNQINVKRNTVQIFFQKSRKLYRSLGLIVLSAYQGVFE